MKSKAEFIYVYTGIGIFYFNPQININGDWTKLKPLHTEGQGLPRGGALTTNYSTFPYPLELDLSTLLVLFGELDLNLITT